MNEETAVENKMDLMDKAAEQANTEFDLTWTAKQVAGWWGKWYKQAGHKRLGRILAAKTA